MTSRLSVTVTLCPEGSQRVAVVSCDGREMGRIDVPTGYVMVVGPLPWWLRLRAWAKLKWWRLRNG